MLLYGLMSLIIVFTDQITKIFIATNYTASTRFIVIPNIFNFVYRKNTGAAFSILSNHVYLLGIVSVLFCIGIIAFVIKSKPKHPLMRTAISMIFAGALGNGIDRIFRGYVVDFIETAFIDFPVFNIADISITVGAALLIIHLLFFDNKNTVA